MDRLKRLYEILETPFGASLEETQRKYRDLAVVWHPDRFAHNPRLQATALEKLKEINGAYNELAAYLKQHGPPPPSSLHRENKEGSEKTGRERERSAQEANESTGPGTAREKAVTPMAARPLSRIVLGTTLLVACLAAGYLLIPEKKGIPVGDSTPARIATPPPENRSSPVAEPHPAAIPQAPTSSGEAPQPTPASPPIPSPKPVTRPAEKAPSHQTKQEQPASVRSVPSPHSGDNLPQRAFERCRVHSPADWCGRVAGRCREYLRECGRISRSDISYRESAECRGVHEWCYNDQPSVIQTGTDEEDQGYEGTE
jgi:hypothetical protein